MARYEIRNTADDTVLSKHRTRQGALDQWRERHVGKPVCIVRTYSDGLERLVVEGVWHSHDDDTGEQAAAASPAYNED
jgi:hypothetical protein